MAHTKRPSDSTMSLLLALLTEPEQQAVLAYVGEHRLDADDTIFVLLSILKIGAVLVYKIADGVETQQYVVSDLQEMFDKHLTSMTRLLGAEREALLDKWGDIMGLEQTIADTLAAHGTTLAAQAGKLATLTKAIDQRIEVLCPLLDLLRPQHGTAFNPTRLVLDEVNQATASGIRAVLEERRAGFWFRWLDIGYRLATTAGLGLLLYHTWT